jgi:hypothetical protein
VGRTRHSGYDNFPRCLSLQVTGWSFQNVICSEGPLHVAESSLLLSTVTEKNCLHLETLRSQTPAAPSEARRFAIPPAVEPFQGFLLSLLS